MHILNIKPKIFLADLIHNQYGYCYGVPLNIGYLAATLEQNFGDAVDVSLFKFPDKLIEALKEKPDILAVSNYDWNVNLNEAIIGMARRQNPELFVVMGGPNIQRRQDGAQQFLKEHPYVNAYVLYEGEEAFAGIVGHLLGHEGHLKDTLVKERVELPQVAYLTQDDGSLVMGPLCPSIGMKHIPHPSAWLSGNMDSYLNSRSFTLSPIVETSRGCFYECTYCTAGGTAATGVKLIRQFDLDTIFGELEYIFKKAEGRFALMFADTNIGTFERDLKTAEKVRRLADKYGKVTSAVMDISKNMPQRHIEIYKILGDLSMPIFAQQTFNEDILVNIKRVNVGFKETKILVDAVHASGSHVTTDLLVGLPGESKEAHTNSIKMAFDADFDRFQVADIRLLLGTEMEEDHSREKYGLKTKVRIIPNAFGVYCGEKVIDYESCIRQTSVMSEREFLELRLFHSHIFLMHNLEIGRPLLDFVKNYGLHPVDLITDISRTPPESDYPMLAKQFLDYMDHSNSEWFDTQEEADAHYMQHEVFEELQKKGFPKLNYDYASKLIVNTALIKEFLSWVAWNIRKRLPKIDPTLVEELVSFTSKRIINFPIDDTLVKSMEMSDAALKEIDRYLTNYCPDLSSSSQKCLVEFVVDKEQTEKIRRMIANITTVRSKRHAVQLVLQLHCKLFLRKARVVSTGLSRANYNSKGFKGG